MQRKIINKTLSFVRTFLTGSQNNFTFKPVNNFNLEGEQIDKSDLYIHVPFCKSLCPYCPYNKINYKKEKATEYFKAMMLEIKRYKTILPNIEIGTIYIGGGTPSIFSRSEVESFGSYSSSMAMYLALFLSTLAICFSSARTPASRV